MLATPGRDPEDLVRRQRRLLALHRLDILDTPPEAVFDMLTAVALEALRAESSQLSLVDCDRQFFKSAAGSRAANPTTRRDGPLSHSFCRFVVEGDDMLCIEDAARDPLLRNHPGHVEDGVVSYLGAPVRIDDLLPVGSLCVTGTAARIWGSEDLRVIMLLAELAGELLRNRAELRTQDRLLQATGGTPVFVTDAQGRIRFWSHDCERVFGWTAADAIGETAHDVLGLQDEAPGLRTEARTASHVLRHREGSHLHMSIRRTPVAASAGSVAHECVRTVFVEARGLPEPATRRTRQGAPPPARHMNDTLQILQSACDLVMRQLSEIAAEPDGRT